MTDPQQTASEQLIMDGDRLSAVIGAGGDWGGASPCDDWTTVGTRLTPELMEQEFTGLFGRSTVGDALTTFYGLDLLVHRWGVGRTLGQQIAFTEEELARIEVILDQLGDNIYTYGASKPALPVPPGSSRQVVVLARVGRAG